jgi:FkbM family methyltransferase
MIQKLFKYGVSLAGGYAFGKGSVPKGVDFLHDLRRYGYAPHIQHIWDVGANVGKFSTLMAKSFPQCRIHAFEPIEATCEIALRTLKNFPQVTVHHTAMGKIPGHIRMTALPGWTMNHILKDGESCPDGTTVHTVPVATIQDMARNLNVQQIDLLKTDTEGHDVEVLQGAGTLLTDGSIFLIFVEVGFSSTDRLHSSFQRIHSLLSDYELVGFYGQGNDANFSAMDRCDALFIHRGRAAKVLPTRW